MIDHGGQGGGVDAGHGEGGRDLAGWPRRESRSALWTAAVAALLGLVIAGFGATLPAAGQTRAIEIGEGRVAGTRVVLGKSQTLRVSRPFVDLVVGDPETADVMPLTDRSLYVLGKKLGTTNIAVYDAEKKLVGIIDVEVGHDASRIAADAGRASPGPAPRVASVNGRTVLSGDAPDAPTVARNVAIARQHGADPLNEMRVRSPQQVMLEVRFVEASRNAGKELGVSLDVNAPSFRGSTDLKQLATPFLFTGATPFGAALGTILANGVRADVLIKALEDRGLARRLAEPNLVALSGEKASFLAGGEFPIPVAGDLNRITIEYKKFGVGLTFTPTVLSDGMINLRIEPEVSQVDPTTSVRTATVTVPGIIIRKASTVVELRDGQSFAVAGLLQSVDEETKQQLPWLGDIPVIGTLFRSQAFSRRETDLAIIVTPRLVKPARPGQRLRTPFDSALPANDIERFLLGRQETPVADARRAVPVSGHILDIR